MSPNPQTPSPATAARLVPLGTNGFIPTFGRQTMSFLVLAPGGALLLDAGTGVARLAEEPVRALLAPYERLDVVLTHYHLDHVIGLSYLTALWRGKPLRLFAPGPPLVDGTPEAGIGRLLAPPLFPITVDAFPLPVEVVPYNGEGPIEAAGLELRFRRQDHPGGSAAVRVGDLLAYATDTTADDATAVFVTGVDLLLHECWATDAEAAADPAALYGHSAAGGVARIARAAHVGRLLTVHHHPLKRAAELARMAAAVAEQAGVEVAVPVEGMLYSVGA